MIRSILVAATLLIFGSPFVWAQPAIDNTPKVATPVIETREQRQQRIEARVKTLVDAIWLQKMQIDQLTTGERQKLQEQILRDNLGRYGVADKKLQDAIVAFVTAQEESRRKLRATAASLHQVTGIHEENLNQFIPDGLLKYLEAAKNAKEERETAIKALDKEINFSGNPRLMAALTLIGIIGDASWLTGDVVLTGSMSEIGFRPFMYPGRRLGDWGHR